MGIAKRLMEDLQEERISTAEWECPVCETPNESYFDVPEVNYSSDDASDYYGIEGFQIECEDCGFKKTGQVSNGAGGLHFDIYGPDGEPIHIETPGYDEYERLQYEEDYYWEPSDDPNDVFEVTMEGMRNLLHVKSPSEHDKQLLKRVIFSQIITALEAYLADTIINLVKGDTDIQHKLYSTIKDLKAVKFEASKIIKRPHLPEAYLIHWLQGKSFHNFPMVDELFKAALGISIYDDEAHETLLNEAKDYRHDCVHRNGKTKAGDKLEIFDRAYVDSVASAAENLVLKVEQKVVAYGFKDLRAGLDNKF